MAAPNIPNWQRQLLAQLGVPATAANLTFLNAWQRAEGGSAANNPFNTTQQAPGATAYNSNNGYPVLNYTSPQQGINATVQTLRNGRYAPIIQSLQQGTSAQQSAQALANSPWGTGALVEKIVGGAPTSPAPSATGSPWTGLAEAFYDPLGSYDNGAFGGAIGGHSDHVHVSETNPQQMLRAIALARSMGLTAGENPYTGNPPDPGVHVKGSYHYRDFPGQYGGRTLGEGLDVSGGTPAQYAKYYNTITGRAGGVNPPAAATPLADANTRRTLSSSAPTAPRALPAAVKQALAILRS